MRRFVGFSLLAALLIGTGCGGPGNSSGPAPVPNGDVSLRVSVQLPSPLQARPKQDLQGVSLLTFHVLDAASLQDVVAPVSEPAGGSTVSADIGGIPVGQRIIRVTAQSGASTVGTATSASLLLVPGTSQTVTLTLQQGRFVYATSETADAIEGFTRDPVSGQLTPLASNPFPTGATPVTVLEDPAGRFVYAMNIGDHNVSAFVIQGDGSLVAVPGSPFAAGLTPSVASIDPAGRFLFVPNGISALGTEDNTVSVFTIDPQSGGLTQVPGSPFPSQGEAPVASTVDPSGHFLFVSNGQPNHNNNVAGFAIDQATGALSPVSGSPFIAGTSPISLSFEPAGRFLYVADFGDNDVFGFELNPNTGALTLVPGTPAHSGQLPIGLVVHPNGNVVYVSNRVDGTVSGFSINRTNGSLTALAGSPFVAEVGINFFDLDPSGTRLYGAVINSTDLVGLTVNPDGTLSPLSGSPFTTLDNPHGVVVAH